jgi:DNA polymerase-4
MTLEEDTKDRELLKKWLIMQCEEVGRRLREENLKGKTITLKLKLSNFRTVTRSHTLFSPTNATSVIIKNATSLLRKYNLTSKARLIGLAVSNFQKSYEQLSLFEGQEDEKQQKIDNVIDEITNRYGIDIIKRGL